ncbi:MAG: hypothetical protein PHF00_08810 [Elusimicrobia bacterium]|nr:hypothetical protein [Elusimicrobiota bacterium]
MKEQARRCCLLVLAVLPIASVAFAAKSALSIDQIGRPNVTDVQLSGCTSASVNGG